MKIVFATNNEHKLSEIRAILGPSFDVVSLADIGCHEDIPETGKTLEENALMKAEYVYNKYHLSSFADDTGLEAPAMLPSFPLENQRAPVTTQRPIWPVYCAS